MIREYSGAQLSVVQLVRSLCMHASVHIPVVRRLPSSARCGEYS